MTDLLDLIGERLDALIEPQPILIETDNEVAHARRQLVGAVLQNGEERSAQGIGAGPNGDPMLDEKSADLVDRRRASRHQPGAHAMQSLQIELILRLLLHDAQVGAQSRLGNGLGVVVVVLLTLRERLDVDCRDDARRVPEPSQRAADEVCAQASL